MKKLFTLFAFLACFLGANAETIVDAEINFANETEVKLGWGGFVEGSVLDIQDGCLHYHSDAAGANPWDTQFTLAGLGGVSVDVGVEYTLEFKIKGSVAGNWQNIGFAGVNPYGNPQVTTEWNVVQMKYVAASTDNSNPLLQCGNWIGDWWIEYIKIYHEGREQKEVGWKIIPGWQNGDAEGEFGKIACAQSKEYGILDTDNGQTTGEWIHAANIIDDEGNKVFNTKTEIVNPQQKNDDGTRAASNDWQNQFWIVFPRPLAEGEPYKVSFKYKASEAAKATTQNHTTPGDYLGGAQIPGELSFTTTWQTYESKELSAPKPKVVEGESKGFQSIAFNLSVGDQDQKEINFYFDEIKVEIMDLKEGYFVAGLDTDSPDANWNTYNFDTAIELIWDDELEANVAVVGTKGDQDSWVNQVMVSTKFGNDKGFKANTIKVTGRVKNDPEQWLPYSAAAKTPINLPAKGVWQVALDPEDGSMNFIKIEGEEDAEPVNIVTNQSVLVVDALERQPNATEQPADDQAGIEAGTGAPWDSQFWIVANRNLKKDEVTVVEFDYVASLESAHTTTQTHKANFQYLGNAAIGDVDFTNAEQHFKKDFTIGDDGMLSIVFNLAEIKAACTYTIKNVKWYLKDADLEADGKTMENLIDATGTANFFMKEGAGYTVHQAGTDPIPPTGIQNVTAKSAKTSTAIYNLAGQRVSNSFKGLVIKDGKKFVK